MATTITYLNADMTLTITTPAQLGLPEINCVYDMANNGAINDANAADCFERLVQVSERLESRPLQGVEI